MQPDTSAEKENFWFLDGYDPKLFIKLVEAMDLVRSNFFGASLGVSRTFCELLLYQIAKQTGLPQQSSKENMYEFINRLYNAGKIPLDHANTFHVVREAGNMEVHGEELGTAKKAYEVLIEIKGLALWFKNDYGGSIRPRVGRAKSNTAKPPALPPSANPNVVPFPKRENNAAPPAPERASPPPLDQFQRPDKAKAEEPRRFGGMFACIAGLALAIAIGMYFWTNREPTKAGTPPVPFTQAQAYTVVPGAGLPHVNERGGPGTDYPILGQIDRGASVLGIARAFDSDNGSWIEMADGRGYVKETLLEPVAATPPPAPAPAQDNSTAAPPSAVIPLPVTPAAQAVPNGSSPLGGSAEAESQGNSDQQSPPAREAGSQSDAPAPFHFTFGGSQRSAPRGSFSRPSNGRVFRTAPRR
jgi:hypothetical protein